MAYIYIVTSKHTPPTHTNTAFHALYRLILSVISLRQSNYVVYSNVLDENVKSDKKLCHYIIKFAIVVILCTWMISVQLCTEQME